MKKIIILLATVLLPLIAGAQAQITTKKVKFGDFTEKITKVVISGNGILETAFKDEIAARWRISPYEFCSLEEFEEIKGSDQYYFLMLTQGQFKKESEPGLQFLTIVKGGKGADESIKEMLEVVSLPIASAEDPSGREIVFLPAFLDILQEHTLAAMEKDIKAYGGLSNNMANILKTKNFKVVFSEDDLNGAVDEAVVGEKFDEDMSIVSEEEADALLSANAPKTLISYVAAPSEPVIGSYSFKMLIDAETHRLYYYRRQKISEKNGAGFIPEDINRITLTRKNARK